MHRGLLGLRGALLILVIGAGLQLASGSNASAIVNAPGTMTVAPTAVVAGSSSNLLIFTYIPGTQRLVDGTVKVMIPSGWTSPEVTRPGKPGSVGSNGGTLSVVNRHIVVKSLTLCKTCSLVLTYSDATAPATPGSYTFLAKAAATPAQEPSEPLTQSPRVVVNARTGMLTVSPDTGLTAGSALAVSGTGLPDSALGSLMECSNAPGQPTVTVTLNGVGTAFPVSCSKAKNVIPTTATGTLPSNPFTVKSPVSGPPGRGNDSAGNAGAIDAALYPCPPTPAQQADGVTCVMEYAAAGTVTTADITFEGQNTGCNPVPTTSAGPPSLTSTPGTCLNGGSVVTLTGSGYDPTSLGTVAECNDDPSQPTVALPAPISQVVPVSCSGISLAHAVSTTAAGDLPAGLTFTIISPTPGPPCGAGYLIATCPTDSSGGSAATDAQAYPCPPTAAQLQAGYSCSLSFGDEGGKTGTVPISFVANPT